MNKLFAILLYTTIFTYQVYGFTHDLQIELDSKNFEPVKGKIEITIIVPWKYKGSFGRNSFFKPNTKYNTKFLFLTEVTNIRLQVSVLWIPLDKSNKQSIHLNKVSIIPTYLPDNKKELNTFRMCPTESEIISNKKIDLVKC